MSDGTTSGWRPDRGRCLTLGTRRVALGDSAGFGFGGDDCGTTPSGVPAETPGQPTPAAIDSGMSDHGTFDRWTPTAADGHGHTHGTSTETGGPACEAPNSATAGKITVAGAKRMRATAGR